MSWMAGAPRSRSNRRAENRPKALTLLASDAKRVKSAERVLRVLEFFSAGVGEATVMDIARAYDMPQSSTSELLKCLTSMGYLAHDPYRRTYKPTARVALLGAGVCTPLFRGGPVFDLLRDLSAATGEFVVIGMPVGLTVRYVHVLPSTHLVTTVVPECCTTPLHTAMGQALLSTLSDDAVRKFAHRLNAQAAERWRIPPAQVLETLIAVRKKGYAVTSDTVWRDGGMVCMPIPDQGDGQLLGVGIGADASTIRARADEYAQLIQEAIARLPRSTTTLAA